MEISPLRVSAFPFITFASTARPTNSCVRPKPSSILWLWNAPHPTKLLARVSWKCWSHLQRVNSFDPCSYNSTTNNRSNNNNNFSGSYNHRRSFHLSGRWKFPDSGPMFVRVLHVCRWRHLPNGAFTEWFQFSMIFNWIFNELKRCPGSTIFDPVTLKCAAPDSVSCRSKFTISCFEMQN